MSGKINPDWIDPGGRSERMEEIRNRDAMERALQDEAVLGDIPMDEARGDTEDVNGTGGSSAPDNPVKKSGGKNQDLEREENTLSTSKDSNEPEAKEDTAKMATQSFNNTSEDTTKSSGNSEGNQSRSRKAVQTCGLMSFQDCSKNGRQLTPVETYKALIGMPVENQPKYGSPSNNDESKTGGVACYTMSSSPLENPSPVSKTDIPLSQTKASLHYKQTKVVIANEQDTKSTGDTSEDDVPLSDGDFSTGSSSSNSLGDIEGVIAKMSPKTRQLVARPLKATQSLPSSKPAQKHNQRGLSKSKTTSTPGYSRHHRIKKLNNDLVSGRKQRDTRSESNIDSKSAPTVSVSPGPDISHENPERYGINEIGRPENGTITPAERSTSVRSGEPDSGEELSDGNCSTGSSGRSDLGDIEDICDKKPRPSTHRVEQDVDSAQNLHSPQLEQKDTTQELSQTKSDTPKCRGERKPKEDALNQKEEGNQTELGEPTDEVSDNEQKPTVGRTVTPDEEIKDTDQASQQSCLRRNPRFARKRYRATTPVKTKPRKRLVNFASFENIRLFSSAKHLLVTTSLVGKSRVRVKKGEITPEEKAIREEEIRHQTKMDSDERMVKQMNQRMGLFKASLSDSDLEEQIDTGYCQEYKPANSLEQSFCENSTTVRVEANLRMTQGTIKPEGKDIRDEEAIHQTKTDLDKKVHQPVSQRIELFTDYLSDSEPGDEVDTGYYQKDEPATSLEQTSCQNDSKDIEDGESSLYPDFNSITPGDMDALTRATDTLFEMIDEPCHLGTRFARKQMCEEDHSIDKTEDQAMDPALGSCSDHSDTSSTASVLAESIPPEEVPARRTLLEHRRTPKLTRFIRSVGHVIVRGIAKTRRLSRACCVQQATG